jgi:predicted nucleic acid-binding protein
MAYLFDAGAIAELLRPRPAEAYLGWLGTVPREEQFTSAVAVAELYRAAFRCTARDRHLAALDQRLRQAVTILPYDRGPAVVFAALRALLELSATPLPDADLQIAATAVYHGLELITPDLRRYRQVPAVTLNPLLANSQSVG